MRQVLLKVKDLKKYFPIRGGILLRQVGAVHAVDGVSFEVGKCETFGIVGESGSGKTTVARLIARLVEPTDGAIYFDEVDVTKLSKQSLRKLRRDIQIVFQNPYASLNPRMTVEEIVRRPAQIHRIVDRFSENGGIQELLESMGLGRELLDRYPHELSGGQIQRVAIARSLSIVRKLLILDEPTATLDVSVQAQIINLLTDLQRRYKLTYLFISHDLSLVKYVSQRIAVMYLGKILEIAEVNELFNYPKHPYTESLLSATLLPDPKVKLRRLILRGEIPSSINPPPGCRLQTRCAYKKPVCEKIEPRLIDVGNEHYVACHLCE